MVVYCWQLSLRILTAKFFANLLRGFLKVKNFHDSSLEDNKPISSLFFEKKKTFHKHIKIVTNTTRTCFSRISIYNSREI